MLGLLERYLLEEMLCMMLLVCTSIHFVGIAGYQSLIQLLSSGVKVTFVVSMEFSDILNAKDYLCLMSLSLF